MGASNTLPLYPSKTISKLLYLRTFGMIQTVVVEDCDASPGVSVRWQEVPGLIISTCTPT
jgi:hypothetical protein